MTTASSPTSAGPGPTCTCSTDRPDVDRSAGSVQPAMRLRELAFGAACAAAVRAAARLGVADALTASPTAVEELAAAVHTEPAPLRRLLRALSCYGVFAENADGMFVHTDMSRLLREDDPQSLRYIALWCTEPWTWGSLAAPRRCGAVRVKCLPRGVRQGVLRPSPRGRVRVGSHLQQGDDHIQHAVGTGCRRAARPDRRRSGRGHRRRPGACAGESAGEAPGDARNADGSARGGVGSRFPAARRGSTRGPGPASSPGTAGRKFRSRLISTSSRTSWNGMTRAPAGPCGTLWRRPVPAPGS